MPNLAWMNRTDLNRLEKTAEPLAFAFYILMAMALVLALAGFGGYGLLLLVLGGCAHAMRAGLEEFVASRYRRAEARPLQMMPPRRAARPAAASAPERRRRVS